MATYSGPEFSPTPSTKCGFGDHDEESPSGGGLPVLVRDITAHFVLDWSLLNSSCLSVRANAHEFTRHVFPSVTLVDMENMIIHALVHDMIYVAAQCVFYLVVGTRRVQHLSDLEQRCVALENSEKELMC